MGNTIRYTIIPWVRNGKMLTALKENNIAIDEMKAGTWGDMLIVIKEIMKINLIGDYSRKLNTMIVNAEIKDDNGQIDKSNSYFYIFVDWHRFNQK